MEKKDKEKAKPIRPDLQEDNENLFKVVNPEATFEISINDKKIKIHWARMGFASRVYYRAYIKKKIDEAKELGLLSEKHFKGDVVGETDRKNTIFNLSPSTPVEDTLKVSEGNKIKRNKLDYYYSPDVRAIIFTKAPAEKITVEYDYYDSEIYDEIINCATVSVMIYLCCRKIGKPDEKLFSSPDAVQELTQQEITVILDSYNKALTVSEEDLKNSAAPQPSGEDTKSQKSST